MIRQTRDPFRRWLSGYDSDASATTVRFPDHGCRPVVAPLLVADVELNAAGCRDVAQHWSDRFCHLGVHTAPSAQRPLTTPEPHAEPLLGATRADARTT